MPLRHFTLTVVDVEDRGAVDPSVFLRVGSTSTQQATSAQLALSGDVVRRPLDVPADKTLWIRISPSRYRDGAVFASVDGNGHVVVPRLQLPRRPDRWLPAFAAFASLPSSFDSPKRVLGKSPRFQLGRGSPAGTLVGGAYDAVTAADESRSLAKMCLLNLCSRLVAEVMPDEIPWIESPSSMRMPSRRYPSWQQQTAATTPSPVPRTTGRTSSDFRVSPTSDKW
jgi:hypothetical protein